MGKGVLRGNMLLSQSWTSRWCVSWLSGQIQKRMNLTLNGDLTLFTL